jgi:membrane associated rhomboid family serine protease
MNSPFGGGYGRPQIRIGGPLTPWVKILLIANAAMFVLVFLPALAPGGNQLANMIMVYLGMTPSMFWGNFTLWMPVTYMFIHAGLLHVGFNMLVLWMFGGDVEQVFGSKSFIVYYFVCGVGAGLLVAVLQPGSPIPTVGASGAIYGIILAFGLFFPERTLLIYGIIPIKAKYLVIILGVMTFLFSVSAPGSGISHLAHLGGMVFGYLYIKQNAIKRWLSGGRKKKKKDEEGKVYNIDEIRRMFEDDDDDRVH